MKTRTGGLVCAILALAVVPATSQGRAAGQSSPLFAAFKTICLDTDADPKAVAALLARLGAAPVSDTDTLADSFVDGSTAHMTRWSLMIAGHKADVFSSTEHIPHHGRLGTRDSEGCSLTGDDGDPRTRAAARAWAAVPRTPGMTADTYSFLADGGKHVIYADKTMEQDDAIMTAGKARMLTVNVMSHYGMLQFLRFHGLADGEKR